MRSSISPRPVSVITYCLRGAVCQSATEPGDPPMQFGSGDGKHLKDIAGEFRFYLFGVRLIVGASEKMGSSSLVCERFAP